MIHWIAAAVISTLIIVPPAAGQISVHSTMERLEMSEEEKKKRQ